MDSFKELTEAKALIADYRRAVGSAGGDCSGILTAVQKKIDEYIRNEIARRGIG